ncbi:MAG: cytochrome c oxidase subunit II, partial [Methylotenera sp.]
MKKTVLYAAILSVPVGQAHADYNLNLQLPVTPIAHQIYNLHTLILLICLFIFVVVFGFMFYALLKHRKAAGHQAVPFDHNFKLEVLWMLIPFLILVGMAYPATKTVLAMRNTSHPDMSIKITGHQWVWEYEYIGEGVRYVSNLATPRDQIDNKVAKGAHYLLEVDQPLVVPTNKKIRVLLTATDVIHSWWVPQLGVKQDAIPGFIHEAWFQVEKPGTYRGQCAELCGVGHGFMPIVVKALPTKQYNDWLQSQKSITAQTTAASSKTYTLAELKIHGEEIFLSRCAACHQANGLGVAGVFPPLVGGAPFSAGVEVTKPL